MLTYGVSQTFAPGQSTFGSFVTTAWALSLFWIAEPSAFYYLAQAKMPFISKLSAANSVNFFIPSCKENLITISPFNFSAFDSLISK